MRRPAGARIIHETLQAAAWAPALLFLVHVVMTVAFDAYTHYPWLDIPTHFLGGAAIAYFFLTMLSVPSAASIFGAPSLVTVLVAVVALTATAAVFWELAEWLWDRTFDTHVQKGLDDTLGDIVLGLIGGMLVATGRSLRRPQPANAGQGSPREGPG